MLSPRLALRAGKWSKGLFPRTPPLISAGGVQAIEKFVLKSYLPSTQAASLVLPDDAVVEPDEVSDVDDDCSNRSNIGTSVLFANSGGTDIQLHSQPTSRSRSPSRSSN